MGLVAVTMVVLSSLRCILFTVMEDSDDRRKRGDREKEIEMEIG
jgi:hypothetical protein